jgi:hypothetical protein
MINIKNFIDKVSAVEGKGKRDIVLPLEEARALKDELSKLLLDLHSLNSRHSTKIELPDSIVVDMVGAKW